MVPVNSMERFWSGKRIAKPCTRSNKKGRHVHTKGETEWIYRHVTGISFTYERTIMQIYSDLLLICAVPCKKHCADKRGREKFSSREQFAGILFVFFVVFFREGGLPNIAAASETEINLDVRICGCRYQVAGSGAPNCSFRPTAHSLFHSFLLAHTSYQN